MNEGERLNRPDIGVVLELYERMWLIRLIEERLAEDFRAGRLPGGVHLYVGQEACAVGMCAHLQDTDWITSTHRGHGHFLAKGGSPGALMAEIYGKASGACGGMGGSMHVADFSKGMMGANGIVGGGLGISTGAALAASLDKKNAVAVCFFGDGAANQGVFMEALNVSALWKLPLVLFCENNEWSEFSPTSTVTAGRIGDRASAFGVPSIAVDGNDVIAVWDAAREAVDRARTGGGPTLIEAATYRLLGHVEAEANFLSRQYRTPEEVDARRVRDPLTVCADLLRETYLIEETQIARCVEKANINMEKAVAFAEAGEPPPIRHATEFMFANARP